MTMSAAQRPARHLTAWDTEGASVRVHPADASGEMPSQAARMGAGAPTPDPGLDDLLDPTQEDRPDRLSYQDAVRALADLRRLDL